MGYLLGFKNVSVSYDHDFVEPHPEGCGIACISKSNMCEMYMFIQLSRSVDALVELLLASP